MKKNIIRVGTFSLLFLIGNNLFSQSPKLKQYYSYINQAELAICKTDYKAAGMYYQRAFDCHTPFTKDVLFAFRLYYKYLHNDTATLNCIHILCQRDTFLDKSFDTMKYSNLWKQAKAIRDTTRVTIIPELAQALSELCKADQDARQRNCSRDTLAYIDSVNLLKLKQLYQQYGGINENMANIHATSIIHSRNIRRANPKDILLKEVLAGNFRANVYANLLDEGLWKQRLPTEYGSSQAHARAICTTLFIFEPKDIQQVNKNRVKLGMAETWDDYITKTIFRYNNPVTDFDFYSHLWAEWRDTDCYGTEAEYKKKFDNKEIKGSYYRR